MAWVSIDDGAPEHRKQLAAGAQACWLWICGLAYCNRQKARDGFIPEAKVAALYPMEGAKRWARRLCEVGLWEPVEGGFRVHDYHEYQPTAEQVSARVEARREAGKRGGIRSGESRRARSKPEANAKQLLPENEAIACGASEANANPLPSPPLRVASSKQQPPDPPTSQSRIARWIDPAPPDHEVSQFFADNSTWLTPSDPLIVAAGLIALGKLAKRTESEIAEVAERAMEGLVAKCSTGGVEFPDKYLLGIAENMFAPGVLEAEREARRPRQSQHPVAANGNTAPRAARKPSTY